MQRNTFIRRGARSMLAVVGALLAAAAVSCAAPAFAQSGAASSVEMISSATATGAGERHTPACTARTFQAFGATSSGSGSATVKVQASNVAAPGANDWLDLGTISLTLSTTRATDGFASDARWRHVRGNVTAISGTGAAVTLLLGC
jgi:hypothetical protein